MSNKRVLSFLLGGVLVTQVGLTTSGALAIKQVVAAANPSPAVSIVAPAANPAFSDCPWPDAERSSMQLEYAQATGRWEMRINHQLLGVDGGLMALRNCPPRQQ